MARVKLWDGPVRLIHWALVGLVGFSWWSSEDHLDWHRFSGYAILGLLTFRIYWGFAGAGAARFSNFVKGPGAVLAYARTLGSRAPSLWPGHNPLGAISVVAILAVLATQVSTGLFAVDVDGLESGPLSDRVSFEVGRVFAEVHELSFRALQALVALHLAAVAFYLAWKRTNLVRPMVTGMSELKEDPAYPRAPLWRLAAGVAIAAALAWAVARGFHF